MPNPLLPFGMTLTPQSRGLLSNPLSPRDLSAASQAVAGPSIGQRAKGLISTLLGAQDDQELQQGLIKFGTNMLQAGAPDTPWGGSFAGALGQALPATRQGLEMHRQEAQVGEYFRGTPYEGLPPQLQMSLLPHLLNRQTQLDVATINRMPGPQDAPELVGGSSDLRAIAYKHGVITEDDWRNASEELRTTIAEEIIEAGLAEAAAGVPRSEQAVPRATQRLLDRRDLIYQDAANARRAMPAVREALSLMTEEGVDTGAGTRFFQGVKNLAGGLLGVSFESADNYARLGQIFGAELLDKAESMKGALSDNDIKFLKESAADLGGPTGSNIKFFEALQMAYNKQIAFDRAVNELEQRYNFDVPIAELDRLYREFEDRSLSEFKGTNPTADSDDVSDIR